LTHIFKVTLSFEDDAHSVDTTLQIIKNNIFTSEDSTIPIPLCSASRYSLSVQDVLEFYNVAREY